MSDEPQRPTSNNRDSWKAYWAARGMPWRTEREIGEEQQRYLAERRAITPDFLAGVYPFKDERLSRADVEWLLATHQSGSIIGPVNMDDPDQYSRDGLDLRGSDLHGTDLSQLPLARLQGGVTRRQWLNATSSQREAAAIHLEDATFLGTHLEGAHLRGAHLEGAYMYEAHLEGSELVQAHLEGAILHSVRLQAKSVGADPGGTFSRRQANKRIFLPPADLHLAFFDPASSLYSAQVGDQKQGGIRIADVRWNDVNLARTNWDTVTVLGDELVARQPLASDGTMKPAPRRLEEYQIAARAYRQLAIALRGQGVSEDADRFAYRAQVLQRRVLWRQRRFGPAIGSWFLDVIAGYGYKPRRSIFTYLIVVLGFAAVYFALTNFHITPFLPSHSSPLAWYEALVLSIGSFHGRGLFPTGLSLSDPLAIVAAIEAIIGLLIEITFIATFTQRFFAR